jgi:hypothetical protein
MAKTVTQNTNLKFKGRKLLMIKKRKELKVEKTDRD